MGDETLLVHIFQFIHIYEVNVYIFYIKYNYDDNKSNKNDNFLLPYLFFFKEFYHILHETQFL